MKQKHKATLRASTALANVLFLATGAIAIYIVVKEPHIGRAGLLPLAIGDLLFGLLSIASCIIAHISPSALLTAYTASTALSLAGFLHLCYTVVIQSYHFERQHVEKLFYTIIAIYTNAQMLRGATLVGCWNSLTDREEHSNEDEPPGKKIISLKNSAQTLVEQQQRNEMYDKNWMSAKQPEMWQVTSIDRDVLKYQNYDTASEASNEDRERFCEVLLPPFLQPEEENTQKSPQNIPEDMGDLGEIPQLTQLPPWQDFSAFGGATSSKAKTLISLDSWEKNSDAWLANRERQGAPSALLFMSNAQHKLTSIPELQPPPRIDAMPQRPKFERSVSAPSLLSSSSSTAARSTDDSIEEFVETTMRRTMSISKLSDSSIYETQRTIPSQPSLYTELSRSRSRYTTAATSTKSRSRSTSPFKKIKELTSSMSSSPTRGLHARHASNKSCNFCYLHSIQNSPSKSQHTVTKSVTSLGTLKRKTSFTNSTYSSSPTKQRVNKLLSIENVGDSPKSNWSETSESSSVPSLAVGQYDKEKWRTLKQMTKC